MHNNGCQSVLKDPHYDGIWYRRVGNWLHYMEKTYQEWLHEVDLSYHILGLRHTLIQKGLYRREEAPHNTTCSPPQAKQMYTTRRITGRTLVYAINNILIHWCEPLELTRFLFLLPQWQCLRWKWTLWQHHKQTKQQTTDMGQRDI